MDKNALSNIKELDKPFIDAITAAKVLGVRPQYIRIQAHKDPAKLGFAVTVVGNRTLIPRIPFINFIEGKIA